MEVSTLNSPTTTATEPQVGLRTRLGLLMLLLLCTIQFMDVADTSIVNVALPSIQHALHFSQQNLQWVASGYISTYGGFLLLGGRAADLFGRRRTLVVGLLWFAVCSLVGGLADDQGLLIAARIARGVAAAIMTPAALSILTTTYSEGKDRNTALGIWGAIAGIGAAAGVTLGGLLSQGPGWRWVLFVAGAPAVCDRTARPTGVPNHRTGPSVAPCHPRPVTPGSPRLGISDITVKAYRGGPWARCGSPSLADLVRAAVASDQPLKPIARTRIRPTPWSKPRSPVPVSFIAGIRRPRPSGRGRRGPRVRARRGRRGGRDIPRIASRSAPLR
jgi:MFS family permease